MLPINVFPRDRGERWVQVAATIVLLLVLLATVLLVLSLLS